MVNWLAAMTHVRRMLSIRKYGSLVVRLLRDPRVALGLKLGVAAFAALIVSPIDVFGDIPVIGALDDVALLVLLADVFVRLCPREIVSEHQTAVGLGPKIKNVTPRA